MKAKKIIGSILKIITFGGAIGGVAYLGKKSTKQMTDLYERYKSYYTVTNQWLLNKNENKDVRSYFEENKIKSVAIYGMGTMGELFYEEVKKTDVKVSYFIDKNAEELYYGLDDITVIGLEDIKKQEAVDAIVVTPFYDFDAISEDLEDLGIETEVISLEDIIYEI